MTEEEIALQEELILQEASQAAPDTPQDRPAKLTALLKDLMALRSMSPTQLATALDLNPSNVTGFLKGQKNPTLSTIDRIAAALDVPAWMLLNTPAEVIADLRAAGQLPPEPQAPAAGSVASDSIASKESEEAPQAPQKPASGLDYDLLTIDPLKGETRRYRLVND